LLYLGSTGGNKKVEDVIKADIRGGKNGWYPSLWVAATGNVLGAFVIATIASIDEGMSDDVEEPGETEGEGGEWTPDDGDCPEDSFPND
jgi:hypothetical protein